MSNEALTGTGAQEQLADKQRELEHDIERVAYEPGQEVLVARDLTYRYARSHVNVFDGVSMTACAGSMLAIMGNNGAGKSTLLNMIANVAHPTSGSVKVGGIDLATLNRRQTAQHIACVAQQQHVPHLSVYDEVLLGRRPHVSWSITPHDRDVVAHCIARFGLEPFVDRYCDELSGGERQKVFIARALAQQTEVLLLDEPTSALDPKNQIEVLEVIREVTQQENLATVLVIHDVNLALRFCDRFLLIRNGEVVAEGGHDVATDETLSQTYDFPMHLVDVEGFRMAISGA